MVLFVDQVMFCETSLIRL